MAEAAHATADVAERKRKRGGVHAHARPFSAEEDEAIKRTVAQQKVRRWDEVINALVALGHERRTAKSVRNRYLRLFQNEHGLGKEQKNLCKVCGQFKKGHSCPKRWDPKGKLNALVMTGIWQL